MLPAVLIGGYLLVRKLREERIVGIFTEDILTQAQTLPGIRVFYTLTDTGALPRNWGGLTGRINDSMIRKLVPDYQERTFYMSGPPDMVRATESMLKQMQVNPNQMKKDFFPGLV